ncbi:MAG TPA: FecR family protein [Candidatus Limnocylindria bacterium]
MKGLRSRPALIALTLAFVLATTGLIAIFFATPVQAHSSTVTVLDGSVLVRHGGGQFAPISDGDIVAGGDTIRTAAESHGVLTFFDGTTVELEPETEITVTTLEASAAGDKIVEITQAIGRTWHVVTHLASPTSQYEIRTPTSTAIVRGTAFEVDVAADGTSAAATTDGDVAVSAQGTEVHVLAGQFTTVPQGAPPAPAQPSPVPDATVQMTLDLVSTAIVTDRNGRAVGVLKGQPVRYIPGSTVRVVDGKLVITIPNAQLGVLTTFVQPDQVPGGAAPADVTIQTQVSVRGVGIVASSLVSQPVENGAAKGALVVMDSGLLLVPDRDARNAPLPHIGKAPAGPAGILGTRTAPTVAPLVTVAPATGTPTGAPLIRTISTVQPLDVTTAAFVPYQTTTTTTAPVANTGLVTLTMDPIFTASPATITTLASATPVPVFTLPPSLITVTTTTIGALATPTPAPLPSIIVIVPVLTTLQIATPTPVPTIGFVPRPDLLIPPTPLPTRPPIIIVTAPPIFILPPTPTPQPVFTIAPILIVLPTLPPIIFITPAPTPTPSPPPIRRICINPLLGC